MCQKKGFFTIAAWQKADDLVVKVYEVTDPQKGYFPKPQLYSLTQQFQSAAVSVLIACKGECDSGNTGRTSIFPP